MKRLNKTKIQQQQGIALIMVLLVVALVTIIATGIASKQKLSTRRTENLLNNEQAYMYLLGAEDWAKDILVDDARNNETDSLQDDLATKLPPIPVDGGTIQGSIEDLQAYFNINSIIDAAGKPVSESITVLKNLLREIDSQQSNVTIPNDIEQAIVDWMDKDQDATPPNGAEDGEYLNRRIPYVTANKPMASTSELIKVNGFTFKTYDAISRYLVALPDSVNVINVNTANAMLISSLSNQISIAQAEDIVKSRDNKGFDTVDEFLEHPDVKGKNINRNLLDVKSSYFLLRARSIIGNSRSELYSVLYRKKADKNKVGIKVLLRSQRRI